MCRIHSEKKAVNKDLLIVGYWGLLEQWESPNSVLLAVERDTAQNSASSPKLHKILFHFQETTPSSQRPWTQPRSLVMYVSTYWFIWIFSFWKRRATSAFVLAYLALITPGLMVKLRNIFRYQEMKSERICKISTLFLPELMPKCFSEACIDQSFPLTLVLLYLLFTRVYIVIATKKKYKASDFKRPP